jgi:hypothetical protein|tara:strand:+ start:926 stop:1108 length:183 start_codon:yes stop_codon:yes gene_type:complete
MEYLFYKDYDKRVDINDALCYTNIETKEGTMELIITVTGVYLIGVINGLIILSMIKDGDL